ncbi:hypothetical protein CBE01nite_21230 [Clostridium beijerinckii]|jgi:hypothetical protein|nr:hypothetical protein CBE01nite_21230 [Clostridium beijerinckii]
MFVGKVYTVKDFFSNKSKLTRFSYRLYSEHIYGMNKSDLILNLHTYFIFTINYRNYAIE